MSEENIREVHRQLRTAQDKYIYFLLAAAASAVALAVARTEDRTLSWLLLPLGLAVLSWGLSFFFGCLHLAYVNSTLYANLEFLIMQQGTHPEIGGHSQMIDAASEGIRRAMASNSERAVHLARWQFGLLILGAVLYVLWHLLEMVARSSHAS